MKVYIVVHEPGNSYRLESFRSWSSAERALEELKDPENLDPFYDDLVAAGGYCRIEDEHGDG